MKIRIIKRTNINGAIVNIGDEADTAFISPNDVRTLLNCGCAVIVKEEQKIETKEANPRTEKAVAVSANKSAKRKK